MPGMQSGLEQFLLLRTWNWTRRGSWTWCRPGRLLNGAGSLSTKQLRRLSHPHHAWIAQGAVSEFPLVVVVLLLIDNDGLLGTGGRKADDARAAEGLSGNGLAPVVWPPPALGSVGLPPASDMPPDKSVPAPPLGLAPAMPLPPCGPVPASGEPPMPTPPSGWPKKPMARGALFCPNMTGFQSSLPVMGSMYFLRRKRMLLVLTNASTLGG